MSVILIVDDESMIRDLATRILTKHNHTVVAVGTADDALAAFAKQQAEVTVAVIDYSLPGSSGFDLVRRFHAIRPDLACIISSGHQLTRKDLPADLQSRVSFLQKPYRSAQLLEAIQKAGASAETS